MMAADGYYYYRYADGKTAHPKKIFPPMTDYAAKKTLPMAATRPFSAPMAKISDAIDNQIRQNSIEFQPLAACFRIAQSGTKYFFDKTFFFTKITTFTNTAIVKKMSR